MRFEEVLERVEALLAAVEGFDEPRRDVVFELLDAIDLMHRLALSRLPAALGHEALDGLRSDPPLAWLLDAYAVGVDERAAAEGAIAAVRPYVESHGGAVEIVAADAGVVRVRLSGSCRGCTGSAVTLREGVERALQDNFPGFLRLEVEEDASAAPHPPPGPTLLQIGHGEGRERAS